MSLLSDGEMRNALRTCPHDAVESVRVRWSHAQDFARAIEAAILAKLSERLNAKAMALLAENERLIADRDAAAVVSSELQETMQRIETKVNELVADRDRLQRDFTYMKQQRDALQTQLDAMQRQEPVAIPRWQDELIAKHPNSDRQYWPDELMFKYACREVDAYRAYLLYAYPKALEPLGRDTVKAVMSEAGYIHVSEQSKADFINGLRHGEKAHGIGSRQ